MNYEDWKSLKRRMAIEAYVIEGCSMMKSADGERIAAQRLAEESDAAKAPADQGRKSVQDWRALEYQMGTALIALEKLGLELSTSAKPVKP